MPRREFARIGTDMPDERSIRALDVEPQWLYDRLLLRDDMSRCGVVPLRPPLWSELAANATEPRIRRWIKALVEGRQVVVDERYQELFVRTYVRHDGLLGQPNVVANMCSDFYLVASEEIRLAFLREFRRIWHLDDLPRSWRGGWLLAVGVYPEPKTGKDDAWPDCLPAASIDRLRKALKGTGILKPFVEAITEGLLEPFTEPYVEGLPEPLAAARPGSTVTPLARVGARA